MMNTVPTPPPTRPMMAAPLPPMAADNGLSGLDVTENKAAGTTTVNFLGDALFDSGKATLKETAKANLDKVAAALKKQYAGKQVRVEGHTDSDPIVHSKWKSNMELSKARADAVRDYLVKKGVDAAIVSTQGYGESKPKGADKAKNRRVEIVVVSR
jgi:chemotaxis protein MotB